MLQFQPFARPFFLLHHKLFLAFASFAACDPSQLFGQPNRNIQVVSGFALVAAKYWITLPFRAKRDRLWEFIIPIQMAKVNYSKRKFSNSYLSLRVFFNPNRLLGSFKKFLSQSQKQQRIIDFHFWCSTFSLYGWEKFWIISIIGYFSRFFKNLLYFN